MKGNHVTPGAQSFQLLTLAETADALRVSRRTVHRLIRGGELGQVRIGGRRFVTSDDLARLVDRSHRRSGDE